MVNNNEDRKVRIKKYRGTIICALCIQVFVPTIRRYQKVNDSLEKVGCLKKLAKKGKPTGKFTEDCRCASCIAHTLNEIERTSHWSRPVVDDLKNIKPDPRKIKFNKGPK